MIEKVMGWLGIENGLCVEFGAWDGFKYSNTANLWEKGGWRAILIEADEKRFEVLSRNVRGKENVRAVKREIGIERGRRWQDIVGAKDADVVSIDVDGNDYWIFRESPVGPRLYVVEHNTTMPAWRDFYTAYARDNRFGCSLGALCRIARGKGYEYIGDSRSNGFFVRDDLIGKIPDLDTDLRFASNEKDLVYMMTSFDGDGVITEDGPYGLRGFYTGKVLEGHEGPLRRHDLTRTI